MGAAVVSGGLVAAGAEDAGAGALVPGVAGAVVATGVVVDVLVVLDVVGTVKAVETSGLDN